MQPPPSRSYSSSAIQGVAALYSRISPGRVLDHERRVQLYAQVRETPGLHARELQRRLGWQ